MVAATESKPTYLYEGMFLLDSGKFAADPDGIANEIVAMLEKFGGKVVSHRPWQDGKLAYEIDGHRKGLHYLAYFEMPGESQKDLTRACKLSELVIRHMVIQQPKTLFDAMVAALEGHDSTAPPVIEEEPRRRPRREERDEEGGDEER